MLRNKILLALCTLTFVVSPAINAAQPKLIVVISLDQFRYDYLSRFEQHFGKGGFRYFLDNGANFVNASFKHATNTTGPGHAALLSGTYGNANGIIANDWYDRDSAEWMYCAKDKGVAIVGASGEGRSPRNFIGSTLGDELRLKYGFNAKVISLSNKDRAAIYMAGRMPSGAFWMRESTFVTSTYYIDTLPSWVQKFNQSKYINSFFGKIWNKKLPDAAYKFVDNDNAPYEKNEDGSGTTFPHRITGLDTSKITSSYYGALIRSPYGAIVLRELAKQALAAEQLGQRGVTDILCVSFSSPDYVGHAYGPQSQEVMDMAVQMDEILADFLSSIEKRIGLKNCVFVLTADHGVSPIPEYILARHPNADVGRIPGKDITDYCSNILSKRFGQPKAGMKWIDALAANNIYISRTTIDAMGVPTLDWAAQEIAESLRTLRGIAAVYTSNELIQHQATTPIEHKMKRSFHKRRSGDVIYALKPYWTEGTDAWGASHGEPYDADAHVPVIFVGEGIRRGTFASEASPIDIGPTLSALLGIEFPAGRDGRVLVEALSF